MNEVLHRLLNDALLLRAQLLYPRLLRCRFKHLPKAVILHEFCIKLMQCPHEISLHLLQGTVIFHSGKVVQELLTLL